MHEPVFSYVPGVSPLHKLDPRTKLVVVMLLGILAFRIENFAGIGTLFILFFALTFVSRFILLLLFAALLTASTDPSAITCGIERMLRPLPLRWLGISSFELATMMNISIAFLPLLFERVERTKAAQAARGMDFVKNPFHSVPALAIPLLRGVIRDAEELALAMESRGYQGKHRTSMHELSMQNRDWIALFVIVLFIIVVLNLLNRELKILRKTT